MVWPMMVLDTNKVFKDINKCTVYDYDEYREQMSREGYNFWQDGPDPFARTNNIWWYWGN